MRSSWSLREGLTSQLSADVASSMSRMVRALAGAPQVGDTVHFWPKPPHGNEQPWAAKVVAVREEDSVALIIFNPFGGTDYVGSCRHGHGPGEWSWRPARLAA
jgi:hypothetical protein